MSSIVCTNQENNVMQINEMILFFIATCYAMSVCITMHWSSINRCSLPVDAKQFLLSYINDIHLGKVF